MKTVKRVGFQGDVGFFRVANLPKGVMEEKTNIVAHSETGHHHVVRAPEGAFAFFRETPMTAYLTCDVPVEIVHERQFDTHETIQLPAGIWQVRRQREHTPEGWRMVAD
jgi:hypothetical protein